MADTIITNSPDRGTVSDSGALGLVLGLIVLAVVVLGGVYLYRHGGVGVPNTGGTNIQVSLPSGGGGADTGGGGGGSGGAGATQ